MPAWMRATPDTALGEDEAVRVELGGRAICLSRVDGRPVAVEDVCAHREVALSDGLVRDGILTCPGHFWRFDLRNGQCVNRSDRIEVFECRVVDDWIELLVPDPPPVLSMRQMLLAAATALDHDAFPAVSDPGNPRPGR
jgi:nitrite reductase/ring-hydroxylating ferredoxin subunit